MTYGYARVSSQEQNEERQLIALKKAGVPERQLDGIWGQNAERVMREVL